MSERRTIPALYLLPGLAADRRLFDPQLREFPSISVPSWLPPADRREPIEAYAARMAQRLTEARQRHEDACPWGERYYLGGFSFGGQVAMEMARHMNPAPAGVVLLCGVRGRHQFTREFLRQQRLADLVPGFVQQMLYEPYARRFARREGLDPLATRLLVHMARDINPAFLKWSAWACAAWKGEPEVRVPVHHLHGERDNVIPDVRREADRTIPGAGHLITLTHPREVSAYLTEKLGGD